MPAGGRFADIVKYDSYLSEQHTREQNTDSEPNDDVASSAR